jgi:anti-sigma factor RsiW
MSCVQPGAITPEDLVAYVDGEAPARVAEHVRRCRRCRSEVERYALVERRLGAVLRRFDCPSPQRLGDMELGLLPPEERLTVAQHVAECTRCTDEVRTLRQFLAVEPAAEPGLVERLRRIVAVLVEPPPGFALGALRGAADATSRTYLADGTTITVSVEPGLRHDRATLMGLVAREARPDVLAGLGAELVGADGTVAGAQTDELGSFSFEDVVPGLYRLQLRLDDVVVVVEDLSVEP